jgi:hypothetical protein
MSKPTTYIVRMRNNADARRIGSVRIPGAASARHTGGKMVKIETYAVDTVRAWLDAAHEVNSYEIETA